MNPYYVSENDCNAFSNTFKQKILPSLHVWSLSRANYDCEPFDRVDKKLPEQTLMMQNFILTSGIKPVIFVNFQNLLFRNKPRVEVTFVEKRSQCLYFEQPAKMTGMCLVVKKYFYNFEQYPIVFDSPEGWYGRWYNTKLSGIIKTV